jgi:hypothetical protein
MMLTESIVSMSIISEIPNSLTKTQSIIPRTLMLFFQKQIDIPMITKVFCNNQVEHFKS